LDRRADSRLEVCRAGRRASIQHRAARALHGRDQQLCGVLSMRRRGEKAMDERQRYEKGMKARPEGLGDPHVEKSLKNRNAFNEEFQEFISRYAWGEIWSRPGLPRETRSMITLAMMVALNRGEELRMHVKAALSNGVTPDQIKEVLLQTAIYCGVPAANSAFHIANEVIRK